MAVLEVSEEQLNEICARIAALHSFKVKRLRPIKIDNGIDCFAMAGEPTMLFNVSRHRSVREMADTIKHELIHYELVDSGKFAGHGKDFKKRAKQLGILGAIELAQCLSGEQLDIRGDRIEIRREPYQAPSAFSTKNETEIADEFERVVSECRTQRKLLRSLMLERRLLIRDRNVLKISFHEFAPTTTERTILALHNLSVQNL
jgi:predicted SprT family Zn-dependent metalloprotease